MEACSQDLLVVEQKVRQGDNPTTGRHTAQKEPQGFGLFQLPQFFVILICVAPSTAIPQSISTSTEAVVTRPTNAPSCPDSSYGPLKDWMVEKRLWTAVSSDDGPGIEEAVRCGANIETRDGTHMTPLIVAAVGDREEAVKTLIRLGAELEEKATRVQGTALHFAAAYGRERIVRDLLAAGAEVGAQDRDRSTPLHDAARYGELGVARRLVEAGANVNLRNARGSTPLMLAWVHKDVQSYLLSVGGRE